MAVSQQRCHVCCTQTGKAGRWEIKAEGNKFLQKHIPGCRGYRLSSSDPATPSAWTRTRGSQHRDGLGDSRRRHHCHSREFGVQHYWGILRDLARRNSISPGTHTCMCAKSELPLSVCRCDRISKITKSSLLCVLFWAWPRLDSACCFSPQPLPSKILAPSQTWVNSQQIHWK